MIVYHDTVRNFIDQCNEKELRSISQIVAEDMKINGISSFDKSQIRAWENSLPAVANVLDRCDIDENVRVAVEYKIRQTRDRIDMIIYGADADNQKNVIIIELKQWSSVDNSNKRHHVVANVGGSMDDHWHPSYQAYNYANLMANFNEYIQNNGIKLTACSYLHNMKDDYSMLLDNLDLYPLVEDAPVFLKNDEERLAEFITKYVKYGERDILYNIENSKIVPSKHLSEMLKSSLEGNDFFSYDEAQANAVAEIEKVVNDALYYNEKKCIIIKGGPGTGKSVVALNALGRLISGKDGERRNAVYLTVNAAPKRLYSEELISNDYTKKALKNLFKYPSIFKDSGENDFDCVFVDEAHRMFEYKTGIGVKKGINLFERMIKAARVCVFFIDEDQAVTSIDYATIERIKETCLKLHVRVIENPELELTSQFRVLGGEDYISFIKSFLGYNDEHRKYRIDSHYEFKVFDSAAEMMNAIKEKDELFKDGDKSGKCRLVAGYTYEWNSKEQFRDSDIYDICLDSDSFKAKWNLQCKAVGSDYSWLNDPLSVEEVGCIHTCQGLDLNYCGVIIGKDLIYDGEKLAFNKDANAKTDLSSGIRKAEDELAEKLIRNTYNVLLTRGMCGTYVYCEDKGLSEYLKSLLINE